MKLNLLFVLILLTSTPGFGQSYTAATYNLRLNIESDGINQWENRKERLANQVEQLAPDILGTQEGLADQIQYLDSTLTNYSYTGVGRDDGAAKGEYAAIFYNTKKFESIKNGTFWLSETPDTVSMGWDAAYLRVCTYTLLFDEAQNNHIWVFNAHLDNEGEQARLESLKLIWENIREQNTANHPVLLMGDFNAEPGSPPIAFLTPKMNDSRDESLTDPEGPEGTFNGFNTSHPLDQRIDYIFVSDDIEVQNYRTINEIKQNRTPSDHLPVFIGFTIPEAH